MIKKAPLSSSQTQEDPNEDVEDPIEGISTDQLIAYASAPVSSRIGDIQNPQPSTSSGSRG